MGQAVRVLLRVRYGECDAQQVVFNARYADYVDIAATEYMRVVFGGYQNVIAAGVDTQVVNLNINWQSPAIFDDVLQIDVQPGRIGNTSYQLNVKFIHHATGREIANAQVTYVVVDTKAYKKASIPDELRAMLAKHGSVITINQAG